MNALEKIVDQIKLKTEAEILRLCAENDKQCEEIVQEFDGLIKNEQIKLKKKIDLFKRNFEFKAEAENLIFQKKQILATKQQLIVEVSQKIVETLCSDKNYELRYFKLMEQLIDNNLPKEKSVIFYGKLDYLRFLENLKFQNSNILKLERSINFDYGALICCSDYKINLNVTQVVSDWIFKFKSDIIAILTQGDLSFEQN